MSMKLGIDVNRHKEIIVKAISGLLLLLLKHFKLNHIYQVFVEFIVIIIIISLAILCQFSVNEILCFLSYRSFFKKCPILHSNYFFRYKINQNCYFCLTFKLLIKHCMQGQIHKHFKMSNQRIKADTNFMVTSSR